MHKLTAQLILKRVPNSPSWQDHPDAIIDTHDQSEWDYMIAHILKGNIRQIRHQSLNNLNQRLKEWFSRRPVAQVMWHAVASQLSIPTTWPFFNSRAGDNKYHSMFVVLTESFMWTVQGKGIHSSAVLLLTYLLIVMFLRSLILLQKRDRICSIFI